MKVVCSPHALRRMKQRGVKMAQIKAVISKPIATVRQANGRMKVIGTLASGGRLAVVYKQTKTQIIIVTVHHAN